MRQTHLLFSHHAREVFVFSSAQNLEIETLSLIAATAQLERPLAFVPRERPYVSSFAHSSFVTSSFRRWSTKVSRYYQGHGHNIRVPFGGRGAASLSLLTGL